MKQLLKPAAFALLLMLIAAAPVPKDSPMKWVVQKNSTLLVQGKTNINKFSCGISQYDACDTIAFGTHPSLANSLLLNGCIFLDVNRFDCLNRLMTQELRKTMHAEKYPKLRIKFVTLDKVAFTKNQRANISGVVDIEIAGITKRFTVPYCFSTGDNPNVIELVGQRTVCFSDFSLTPPKKLNGMVQAKDELDIQFHLVMKRV